MMLTATVSQIPQLASITQKWTGPISVAIHIASESDIDDFFIFYQRHKRKLGKVSFHFLLERFDNRSVKSLGSPLSRLLQLASDQSQTDYILHFDIDFVPDAGSYPRMVETLQTDKEVRNMVDEQTILFVPKFEWSEAYYMNLTSEAARTGWGIPESVYPTDRESMRTLFTNEDAASTKMPYFRRDNEENPLIAQKWVGARNGSWYTVPFQPGFEGIALTRRNGVPGYWPNFTGPWYPKVAFVEECDAHGYKLAVLKKFFAFRTRKADPLPEVERWANDQYKAFRKHLPDRYQTHFAVPTVEDFETKLVQPSECQIAIDGNLSTAAALTSDAREQKLLCEWYDFTQSKDHRRQVPRVIQGVNVDRKNQSIGDISLVIHGSIDRMGRLLNNAKRWVGPISVAVYTKTPEQIQKSFAFFKEHSDKLSKVTFHFFFEKILVEKEKLYPHNYVRNCALNFTDAEYVIILDVDFVPNRRAYGDLHDLVLNDTRVREALDNKTLMVLPAFESTMEVDEDSVNLGLAPPTKKDLIREVNVTKTVEAFHLAKFQPGHGPTNFSKWYNYTNSSFYKIEFDDGFEPYVLAKREGLPWFWTGFRGFGKNKLSWYEDADVMGYQFAVLRDFFVFHIGASSTSETFPWWTGYEYKSVFQIYLDVKARDRDPKKSFLFQSRKNRFEGYYY
uniref:Uncharacterized protein n=1 Tax=Entomoneis paludosa TaxID=265537 RepID=A0A7S3DWC4_9STRA